MCIRLKFDHTNKWDMQKPEPAQEKKERIDSLRIETIIVPQIWII